MLGVKSYPRTYVDACRAKIAADVDAYRAIAAAASDGNSPKAGEAIVAFEPVFFNNLVIVLDSYFMHRLRTLEGKDGNPANEVRVLAASLMSAGGKLEPDKTIKLVPAKSVLGHAAGDEISLSETDFLALSAAYFDEIEKRFMA